jgi:5-methylcytosine-specific restriction endonuclease McrA
MKRIPKALRHAVWQRAGGACEYCKFPEAFAELRFVLDHVLSRQHLGRTTLDNLALCCPFCNRHKGPNVSGVDPVSESVIPLFHPRRDRWHTHFRWNGARIVGKTPKGRATVIALALNHSDQVEVRVALMREGTMKTN